LIHGHVKRIFLFLKFRIQGDSAMLRIMVGVSVVSLLLALAGPVHAQANGQKGQQAKQRHMQPANGQNNANMANQAVGRNNPVAGQDMSDLAQVLITNYDADGSGALDASELAQALVGLRELMMRNQRGMQNANSGTNANAANGPQAARGMDMRRGMGPGGRGTRPRGDDGGN
jgi:hypothetical protein